MNCRNIPSPDILTSYQNHFTSNAITTAIDLAASTITARYILFLKPDSAFIGKPFPDMILQADGKTVEPNIQQQSGSWATYSLVLNDAGSHHLEWQLKATDKTTSWSGKATIWLTGQQQQKGMDVTIIPDGTIQYRPMLPSPYAKGALKNDIFLGATILNL